MRNTTTHTGGMLSRGVGPRRSVLTMALALAGALLMSVALAPSVAFAEKADYAGAHINNALAAQGATPVMSNPDVSIPSTGPGLIAITNAPTARRSTVSADCGFNIADTTAYYNHCGPTWVCIRVRVRRGFDYNRMVPAWTNTVLGPTRQIDWAWYIRPNCW